MKCEACGMENATTHACTGATGAAVEIQHLRPPGFALGHYLGEAWRIVRWDDKAIRRTKDDPRALRYGILFYVVGSTVPWAVFTYLGPGKNSALSLGKLLYVLSAMLFFGSMWRLIQLGLVHLIAKNFCAGDGKFIQILRPLSLASLILVLEAVPSVGVLLGGFSWAGLALVGYLLGGIVWVCVMVMVFDVVHGMPQLTAFLVAASVAIGLRLLVVLVFKLPF